MTEEIQPTEIPVPPMATKNNNLPLLLGGILVLLLLLVGAVYAGMKIQEIGGLQGVLSSTKAGVNYNSPTLIPTAVPTVSETINWKTYTNSKYGFEFKYPSTWNLLEYSESPSPNLLTLGFFSKPIDEMSQENSKFSLGFQFSVFDSSVQDFEKYHISLGYKKNPSLLIGGKNASQIVFKDKNGSMVYNILDLNGKILFSSGYIENDNSKTFDQILSTFKFLK